MGAKIGKRCYMECDAGAVCEPDLITIGDYVTIEPNTVLQVGHCSDQ